MSSETATADTTTTAATAETTVQDSGDQKSAEAVTEKLEKMKISASFSIWPPTQRTRDAVITRVIETLSTPSVLSNRYGTVSPEDASALAKSIEDDAFTSASAIASSTNDHDSVDGGIEILQVYSKEISKRVLDAVKSRSTGSDRDNSVITHGSNVVDVDDDVVVPSSEDVSESAVAVAADADDESSTA